MGNPTSLSRRASEFLGVLLFAAALLWLVSLATYQPSDPAWFFNASAADQPLNFAGRVGAFLAELSFQLVGYSAYLFPPVLIMLGWHYFWCRSLDAAYTKLIGAALLFACISALMSLAMGPADAKRPFLAGGYLGDWFASMMAASFNHTGAIIVILTLLFLAIILSTQFSFGRMFSFISTIARGRAQQTWSAVKGWREERRREKQRRDVIAKHLKKADAPKTVPQEAGVPAARTVRGGVEEPRARAAIQPPSAPPAEPPAKPPTAKVALPAAKARPAEPDDDPEREPRPAKRERPVPIVPVPLPLPEVEATSRSPIERRKDGFVLPPPSLLDAAKIERRIDERELMDGARLLEEKCREFSVDGTVVQIHPGPVVTTFEFKPEAGVKYSKITGLADDLCLAMQAESVLIERLPGKSTVGIQIPNPNREHISLRDLLESEPYRRSTSRLSLAMGKTIHGEPFVTDLATMPHLLIAGSTGTGKSVAINSMLTSILYRATPEDVRLIMIDPKRLELGMYEDIPHLLTPVVVDPKQATNALNWAVREMEERYKTLAAEGVRNIEQYNRNIRLLIQEKELTKAGLEPKVLPFVVVIIDELADLMMVASNDVEESICRLAQMARAVGIHLILATQRPSVDVITGLIKANLPARISFRVSSKTDSRTILDSNGAEQLLGRGDMLYLPPASSRLVRLHGPYISEQESARLASFLRKQGKPIYDDSIVGETDAPTALDFEKDELYDEAARIVVASGQASISYLQRRLRIGFSRAARLVDMMEADGLVSGAAGGKPRELLVSKDYFEEVDAQLR